MSHEVQSKTPIKDLKALHEALKGCPDLELRKATEYRWYGRSVGDYAPPALRQLSAVALVKMKGHDVHKLAKDAGVTLPASLTDLEENPLDMDAINKLRSIPEFKEAFDAQNQRIGKDAEYVIGFKKGHPKHDTAYEVGVVPHPFRKGEYHLSVDYWDGGKGLMAAKGLGDVVKGEDGSVDWGQELRQRYTLHAMSNRAEAVGRKVTKIEKLADGSLRMEIEE